MMVAFAHSPGGAAAPAGCSQAARTWLNRWGMSNSDVRPRQSAKMQYWLQFVRFRGLTYEDRFGVQGDKAHDRHSRQRIRQWPGWASLPGKNRRPLAEGIAQRPPGIH